MKVNLSVPRFDVSASADLMDALQQAIADRCEVEVSASADLMDALQTAGLTKLFEPNGNAFSPSVRKANENGDPVYLDSIRQDPRVQIDEKGVVAASYIELDFGAGAAEPPAEIIDFVLDRPFLFAVTKSDLPLFVGAVNTL